ncbi:hypothetical protein BJX65DRAFT_310414 [Aspergillus insuetus]
MNHAILPPFPTNVPPDDGGKVLCFRDHNAEGHYGNFSAALAGSLANDLCVDPETADLTLSPNDPERIEISPDREVKAWVRWAENQSGCKPKKDFSLEDNCVVAMLLIETNCDFWLPDAPGSFGGGFVTNAEWGCLEFGIVRDTRD